MSFIFAGVQLLEYTGVCRAICGALSTPCDDWRTPYCAVRRPAAVACLAQYSDNDRPVSAADLGENSGAQTRGHYCSSEFGAC